MIHDMDYAIIGGGLAGLTVAYELSKKGLHCEVFEKSRVVGGRMSTRRLADCIVDDGAQYFTVETPEFATLLRETGAMDNMQKLGGLIVSYPFQSLEDALAQARQEEIKRLHSGREFPFQYVFREGMVTLPKLMADSLKPKTVNLETYVEGIRWNPTTEQWDLHTRGDNTTLGGQVSARRLVFALPAPQTAQILARSVPLPGPLVSLAQTLEQVEYHRCITLILKTLFDHQFEGVGAFRALPQTLPMGWVAWAERLASERVPDGESAMVIQLSPESSQKTFEVSDDIIVSAISGALRKDLHIMLPTLRWMQVKRWRFANPSHPWQTPEILAAAEEFGIYICGDFLERGRIESAFLSGYKLASQLD